MDCFFHANICNCLSFSLNAKIISHIHSSLQFTHEFISYILIHTFKLSTGLLQLTVDQPTTSGLIAQHRRGSVFIRTHN